MSYKPEELLLDGVPALRWGKPGGQAVVGVHGQFSNKHDPVMSRCGDVIASRGARAALPTLRRGASRKAEHSQLDHSRRPG